MPAIELLGMLVMSAVACPAHPVDQVPLAAVRRSNEVTAGKLGDQSFTVEIEETSNSVYRVSVDGNEFVVDGKKTGRTNYSLIVDNRSFEHNDEINVAFRENEVTSRLRRDFETDLAASEVLG